MNENDKNTDSVPPARVETPRAKPRREARFSWIWLVPLVAVLVGASLLFRDWLHTGPTVTISFESADGLEVGQTRIRYKDVVIGTVSGIKVAPNRKTVLVSAELDSEGSEYITQKDSRFWVVRPRLGISGITGLGTILSGAYISVDAPQTLDDKTSPVYHFEGLEQPPEVRSGRPGTRFVLVSKDLGSLDIGAPVYFRKIQVGQVVGYSLEESGEAVKVQVFVDAPHDKFVTRDTRFWNAGGINLSLDADGFKVETGSLVSVVAGGVAFAAPEGSDAARAAPNTQFALASTREKALADPDGLAFPIVMSFAQSVRGLKVGAPIDFRGLELGNVSDIDLAYDAENKRFYARVQANLYPMRLGGLYDGMVERAGKKGRPGATMLSSLVLHGLRAQMRAANLLTGQQYIALDFFPDAPPLAMDTNSIPLAIPTVAGSFDRLQQQISNIVDKVEAIPFEDIGKDLSGSLKSLDQLMRNLDGKLAPQATSMLRTAEKSIARIGRLLDQNSPLNDNLESTMRELSSAARSLRALADYLQTHPSSLIRGRAADPMPVTP